MTSDTDEIYEGIKEGLQEGIDYTRMEISKRLFDISMGKLLRISMFKDPSWESLHDFGITFGYCETSVSGHKVQISVDLGWWHLYFNIWEVEDDTEI